LWQALIQQYSNLRPQSDPVVIAQDVADVVAGLIEMESPPLKSLLLLLIAPDIAADGLADVLFPPRRRRLLFVTPGVVIDEPRPGRRSHRRSTPWRFRATSAALPFADGSVDFAVALFRRDRLMETRPALAELHRTLRKGCALITAVLGEGVAMAEQPGTGRLGDGCSAIAWCRTLEEHGHEVDVTVTTCREDGDGLHSGLRRATPAPGVRRFGPTARYAELPHSWSSLVIGAHRASDA
jgi:hypothetical protein